MQGLCNCCKRALPNDHHTAVDCICLPPPLLLLPGLPCVQAMMELGATVCKPVNPLCEACPVSSCCAAYKQVGTHTRDCSAAHAHAHAAALRVLALPMLLIDGVWTVAPCCGTTTGEQHCTPAASAGSAAHAGVFC